MAWYDWVPGMNTVSIVSGLTGNGWSGSKSLKDAWNWGKGQYDDKASKIPQIGDNPYQGNWNGLIGQLEQQARGEGPSLAGNAYNQAHGQAMQDYQAMSHGGSAGAARMAQRNMGMANQGLAAGYSNARLQEQLAARQMLQGALGGAGAAWFAPQQANQNAMSNFYSSAGSNGTTNMQQLTGLLQQLGMAGGKIAGM